MKLRWLGSSRCKASYRCVALGVVLGLLGASVAWAQTSPLSVTVYSSMQTFRVGEIPPGGTNSIRLSAARGETESFQLALANRSGDTLRNIRISVSGMAGVETAVFAANAVNVTKPGRTGVAVAGRYFDLLRPVGGETVARGEYRPYWVDLKVGPSAAPGERIGQVTVTTPAGTQVLPVRLQVRDFQLPVAPSLKLAFAFGLNWMETYYGKALTRDQVRAAQDVMLEHRLGPLPMWNGGAELFSDEERLKQCLTRGMNIVLLSCGGETDEQIEISLAALESKIATLKRLGALDRTYLFGYDEIAVTHPERIPAMRKAYERFHQRHPGIQRINTSQPDNRLKDFVDIFVVPTSQFLLPMAQRKEVWWYSVGNDSLDNEPDFRIDFPAMAQRGFFLADWKAGVKGHLYWAVQREWPVNKDIQDKDRPENEWRPAYENCFSKKWTDSNGGGNLFYPDGTGSMLPTPRVKRVRDGIEDYEYLAQLQAIVSQLASRKPRGWEKLLGSARELLTVPDDVVRVGAGWCEGWSVAETGEAACTMTIHPRAIHGGKQALRILPGRERISVTQDVPVTQEGNAAIVSGWLKTNDLNGKAHLIAEYLDVQGRAILSMRSEPVTGSTEQFQKQQVTLSPAPSAAKTLRLGVKARAESAPADSKAPLQKVFADDFALRVGGKYVTLVNPGFESRRLRLNFNPAPLFAYRERVAACLEQCVQALR